jgi:hypothetical protein
VTVIATLIVVLVGVLFSNRHVETRIGDLRAHMDARFGSMYQLFQERRIEAHLHMR